MMVIFSYILMSLVVVVFGVDKRFPGLDRRTPFSYRTRLCNPGEVCKKVADCEGEMESLRYLQTCNLMETEHYVCCKARPSENGNKKKCLDLYQQRGRNMRFEEEKVEEEEEVIKPQESKSDVNAVGGENAAFNEFPYMAALGWGDGQSKDDFLCGGVLIDQSYVLTAAHCTAIDGDPPKIIRLGGRNLLGRNAIDMYVDKIIVHPDYDPNVAYHDIALIQLKSKVRFLPACLWAHSTPTTEKLVALGYGHTQFAGENSNILQKVNISLFDNIECEKVYRGQVNTPNGISRNQICAGDYSGTRDTCQGDSGGPLLVMIAIGNQLVPQVVGITSVGSVCAGGTPSIYTRVSEYIDWIEKSIV